MTLPKFRLLGLPLSAPGVTPEPDKGITTVEEVDATVTLPLAEPEPVGLKATLKLADCPAARETGRLMPLRLKPGPLAVTPEILTLVPPVLVMVSERVRLFPTVTLPKFRLLGLPLSAPGMTPVPDKGTATVDEVEATVTLPLAEPEPVGLKATLKLVDCPAPRETGRLMPLTLKATPVAVTAEMVTLLPPELVMVSDKV